MSPSFKKSLRCPRCCTILQYAVPICKCIRFEISFHLLEMRAVEFCVRTQFSVILNYLIIIVCDDFSLKVWSKCNDIRITSSTMRNLGKFTAGVTLPDSLTITEESLSQKIHLSIHLTSPPSLCESSLYEAPASSDFCRQHRYYRILKINRHFGTRSRQPSILEAQSPVAVACELFFKQSRSTFHRQWRVSLWHFPSPLAPRSTARQASTKPPEQLHLIHQSSNH